MAELTLENEVRRIVSDLRGLGRRLLAFHAHDSRHSAAGFLDWVFVGERGVLYRELKRQKGRVTAAQQEWLDALTAAGQDAAVWRPADLYSGRIARELAAVAGLRGAA